jgi:hypothetical protein
MRELSVSTIVGRDWRDLRPSLAVLLVLWLEFGNRSCQCDEEAEQFFQGPAFKYETFSGIDEWLGKAEQGMLVEAKLQ